MHRLVGEGFLRQLAVGHVPGGDEYAGRDSVGAAEAGRLRLAHPQEAGVQVLAVDLLGTLDSKLFSQSRSICARV
ncbi:MAG TPA: hypothetical protein VEZ46_09460 [Mycobacteriales bacterium]|nr:hypothetical protein [Mycobacteriales bacterium]